MSTETIWTKKKMQINFPYQNPIYEVVEEITKIRNIWTVPRAFRRDKSEPFHVLPPICDVVNIFLNITQTIVRTTR